MYVLRRPVRPRGQAGYATAELALTLPVLLLVVLAGVWMVSVVSLKSACSEAVRLGARAAARGESADVVRAVVGRELPPGAVVAVDNGAAGTVTVRVSVPVRPQGALAGLLPSLSVAAAAEAATEAGTSAPGEQP